VTALSPCPEVAVGRLTFLVIRVCAGARQGTELKQGDRLVLCSESSGAGVGAA
jgi:hypothetical protein